MTMPGDDAMTEPGPVRRIEVFTGAGPGRGGRDRRGGDQRAQARAGPPAHVRGPGGPVRVLVATKPVDFRKGMDGLAALVKEQLRADPFSGVVYVFRAKRADRVKLV